MLPLNCCFVLLYDYIVPRQFIASSPLMKQRWQLYRWATKSQGNYVTFYMTYAHKINNHSYWQVRALHASVVSSLAMPAVLICEKFRFYEGTYEILVKIFFSSVRFYLWCTHSVKALSTSVPSPGYHWVRFLSAGTKVPLLKLHQFWLLAWSSAELLLHGVLFILPACFLFPSC